MASLNVQPSHIGLCVSDLDRSMRFYCDGLGFSPAERFDLSSSAAPGLAQALEVDEPVELVSQMITNDSLKIELLAYRSPAIGGAPSASRGMRGLTHLSFYVDDIDASLTRLIDCGGTLVDGTRQDLGVELLFIADPDGTRIELMREKPQ